ncbi:MAG TPA: SDR family oxidoreductase [Jatrophihabitans sp.]|nr:SDR family oxidoreductase [Jatrophihabitans sp.]
MVISAAPAAEVTRPRTALVTGASRGIGRAIAERLAAEGYDVTISARDRTSLDAVARQLSGLPSRVTVLPANMAAPDEVDALARAQCEFADRLDLLVLAAGVGAAAALADDPLRRFDMQLAVNLAAPLRLVHRLLPALRAAAGSAPRTGAKIIAMASITGVASEAGLSVYGATKAALISLCETITVEEAAHGVTATAISPGYVDTDMTAWMRDRLDPADMISVQDIVELAIAVSRLSRNAVVPNIVVTRPGARLWRA